MLCCSGLGKVLEYYAFASVYNESSSLIETSKLVSSFELSGDFDDNSKA